MKLDEADVIWTPESDQVRVERHLAWKADRSSGDRWMPAYSLGARGRCPRSKMNDLLGMFILFNTITVRDQVDVRAAHAAFLEIDEYRETISPGTEGADWFWR
jgi:hypothetical protein